MAKVVAQTVVININKLAKNDDPDHPVFLDEDTVQQLVAVIEELLGDKSLVVEVNSDQ